MLDGGVAQLLALVLFTVLILLALGGNVLVCMAIFVDRKLRRQPENLFLVSLAVSDLFVSVLVMIFAAANDLLGYWPFGEAYCQFWICLDITCSTASILNLCAIAFDRYLHISRPMKYSRYSNKSTISLVIILVWLLSAVIGSAQLIFGATSSTAVDEIEATTITITDLLIPFYDHSRYRTTAYGNTGGVIRDESSTLMFGLETRPTCYLKLRPLYAIFSSLLSFFLPATIMVLLYTKLYLYARMHVRSIRSQLRQATSLLIMQLASHTALHYGTSMTTISATAGEYDYPMTYDNNKNNNNNDNLNNNNNNNRNNNDSVSDSSPNTTTNTKSDSNESGQPLLGHHNSKNDNGSHCRNTSSFVTVTAAASSDAAAAAIPATTAMIATTVHAPDHNANLRHVDASSFPEVKCNKSAVSDQKARMTLGAIMGTFLICWLPFFIVNVLRSLLPHLFSQRMFQVVTWLGYANSTANPVIYGIFNRDFRRAFSRIVFKIFYCFDNKFDSYKPQRSPFFHHHSKL